MKPTHESDALLLRIAATIKTHFMLTPGARVLAAVSGGVDSMVMLDGLCRLGYRVEAAHFDHQTRDGASTEDAAFVQQTCAEKNIPCHLASEAVFIAAKEAGRSFEEYARERRYAFLMEKAVESGCNMLATAHHEDDQAETMLMGLLGLSSGFGLTGMRPVYEKGKVRMLKPLLHCSREAIVTYAREHNITWCKDATNSEACCTRNRVRLELLPILREYNPRAGHALARMADIMQTDGDCLDIQVGQFLDSQGISNPPFIFERKAFLDIHEALQRRLLKRLSQQMGVSLSYERTLSALQFIREVANGGTLELGGDVILYRIDTRVFLQLQEHNASPSCTPLAVPGETPFGRYVVNTRILSNQELSPQGIRDRCLPTRQYFDADKLTGKLHIRSRQPGDRMMPLGMSGMRKVQDIMVDLHIPAFQRDAIPLIFMDEEILWIAGYTRSCLAPVDNETKMLLELSIQK